MAGLSGVVSEGRCGRGVGVYVADIESYFNKVHKGHVREGVEAMVGEGAEHLMGGENRRGLIERMGAGKKWREGNEEDLMLTGGVAGRSCQCFDKGRCRV